MKTIANNGTLQKAAAPAALKEQLLDLDVQISTLTGQDGVKSTSTPTLKPETKQRPNYLLRLL